MRTKRLGIFFIVVVILGVSWVYITRVKQKEAPEEITKEINPVAGSIKTFISCTGTVLPKNRLEIKPPVNGRIERILVSEGDNVKTGDILALMSSTDRAALLDAARGKGETTLKYWEDVYKPIPLPSPIDGEVIVATVQPGQTVTTADPVVVLSDRLIVRAQVDETDIGKITTDKKAVVSLDAYPDKKIKASVEHIYYESQTVNNVTIYSVDLTPEEIPPFFRSGMNASIDFIDKSSENALLIPMDAVHREKGEAFVLVKQDGGEPLRERVTLGVSDDKNVEVVSGLKQSDTIIVRTKRYAIPQNTTGTNPFMPFRRR